MSDIITPDMTGCWLDGHAGWHNHYRVVELAVGYGFDLKPEDEEALDAYAKWRRDEIEDEDGVLFEVVVGQGGLVDQATDHLEGLAPAGHHLEWDMGELSLLACSEIEGDTCEGDGS